MEYEYKLLEVTFEYIFIKKISYEKYAHLFTYKQITNNKSQINSKNQIIKILAFGYYLLFDTCDLEFILLAIQTLKSLLHFQIFL